MTEQLSTPLTHRLIALPLGLLFQSRLLERVKVATVDRKESPTHTVLSSRDE
jgi:hypothetical protein